MAFNGSRRSELVGRSECCQRPVNASQSSADSKRRQAGGGWRRNQVYWRLAYWRVAALPAARAASRSISTVQKGRDLADADRAHHRGERGNRSLKKQRTSSTSLHLKRFSRSARRSARGASRAAAAGSTARSATSPPIPPTFSACQAERPPGRAHHFERPRRSRRVAGPDPRRCRRILAASAACASRPAAPAPPRERRDRSAAPARCLR